MTGLFHARVDEGGKLVYHLDEHERERRLLGLAGKRVEVVVREPKKRGSGNQQKYYFGVLLKRIAEEIGEYGQDGIERIHDGLMRQFFPVECRGFIGIRKSYMDLTSQERERYHENIRIAASTGDLIGSPLWLPLPNEEAA